MSGAKRYHDLCLNCSAPLSGAWCSQCGQKDPSPHPLLGELVREATHELAHWDGKLLSTLRELVLRPGQLTVDFLGGRRARWLPPLRLYLITSLVYFLIGPTIGAITHRDQRVQIVLPSSLAAPGAESEAPTQVLKPEVATAIDNSSIMRIVGSKKLQRAIENPKEFGDAVSRTYPKVIFLLMPVVALLLWGAYRSTVPGYVPHLYFSLHLHAFGFSAFAVLHLSRAFLTTRWLALSLGIAALLTLVWYATAAMRRVYGGSWGRTVGSAAAVGAAYSVVFLIAISSAAIVALALF